jgi:hypothetical protein
MDIGAELTLQIARLVHERSNPLRSPAYWSFWPHGGRATWSEARHILASAEKPLFVAPLVEPGVLGLWNLDSFNELKRAEFEHQFANQIQYYTEKLALFGLLEEDRVRFEPATPECTLSVSDFLRWARDYAIGVGISIAQSPEPRVARITVRPPGGGGPPLGMQASPYAPAS